MGDTFQSKDIMKLKSHAIKHDDTTSYERDEPKKAISVQGMYVVAVHREPTYFDAGLRISSIETNEADIAAYTEVTQQLMSDSTVEILDVNCNRSEIEYYQSIAQYPYDDSTIEIVDVNCNESDIYYYEAETIQAYTDSTVEICNIDHNSSTIISSIIEDTPKFDFGLRIVGITTNTPTISSQ